MYCFVYIKMHAAKHNRFGTNFINNSYCESYEKYLVNNYSKLERDSKLVSTI